MVSSERSQPLSDPQQITFIVLNRFWSLSKKPFTLLLLTDKIKLDGMQTKIKLKIQVWLALCFKFWEYTSVKSYKIQLPVLSFLVSHQFLHQQISKFLSNFSKHDKSFCQISLKFLLNFFLTFVDKILQKHFSELLLYIYF